MKFKTKIVEIKTSFSTEDGGTSNKDGFLLAENTKINLSNKYTVSIPRGVTIHNGSVIGYKEHSNRVFINDLSNVICDNPITIKLQINYPIFPESIQKYIPNFIVKALTEITIIPYFNCDCLKDNASKTVSIYGKENFEKHNAEREKYINIMKVGIHGDKFALIKTFCPYYGTCISEFPKDTFINNKGEEKTQFELDMIEIEKMTKGKRP